MTISTRFTQGISGISAIGLSLALLAGCGGDEQADEVTATTESPQMIQRQAPRRTAEAEPAATETSEDFRVVPKLDGQLEEDGLGLETIIDASSKEAYAESLRWISQDVSPEQFKRLEQSLRFIQAYDSSVLGNKQRFYETIDGKTGQELIDRASKLVQERG